MTYPSIFNDVIGPIMRGPSSSHCAAAVRIGRIARDIMGGEIERVLIEFDPGGSLATTHESQGSDMGLFGGLLGWDTSDERLIDSCREITKSGIQVDIKINDLEADHPNTYQLTLSNKQICHRLTAISTGGGMIEITEIDGVKISICGDYFETLIFTNLNVDRIEVFLTEKVKADTISSLKGPDKCVIEIKSQKFLTREVILWIKNNFHIDAVIEIKPVLPILSRKAIEVPFINCREMLRYNQKKEMELWELAIEYESNRGNLSKEDIFLKMEEIVDIIRKSIEIGIRGTEFRDRILHHQSGEFLQKLETQRLLEAGLLNRIVLYTTAIMEVKSSMGVIVAAPTAGACAGLPGACFGAADEIGLPTSDLVRAILSAGLIGVFIAKHATFAAEVGGCQAECGAGSGMAAAGLVSLAGGSVNQAVAATSMALQNTFGMVCDPVANRVEVPCLGKNVLAASNALSCANMALANYNPVIPLDEVIDAMYEVGSSIPVELRCTGLGGLSVTKTSKKIESIFRKGQR